MRPADSTPDRPARPHRGCGTTPTAALRSAARSGAASTVLIRAASSPAPASITDADTAAVVGRRGLTLALATSDTATSPPPDGSHHRLHLDNCRQWIWRTLSGSSNPTGSDAAAVVDALATLARTRSPTPPPPLTPRRPCRSPWLPRDAATAGTPGPLPCHHHRHRHRDTGAPRLTSRPCVQPRRPTPAPRRWTPQRCSSHGIRYRHGHRRRRGGGRLPWRPPMPPPPPRPCSPPGCVGWPTRRLGQTCSAHDRRWRHARSPDRRRPGPSH